MINASLLVLKSRFVFITKPGVCDARFRINSTRMLFFSIRISFAFYQLKAFIARSIIHAGVNFEVDVFLNHHLGKTSTKTYKIMRTIINPSHMKSEVEYTNLYNWNERKIAFPLVKKQNLQFGLIDGMIDLIGMASILIALVKVL